MPHASEWNCTRNSGLTDIATSLIAIEEEQFVFDDWAADGATVGISNQLGTRNCGDCSVIEKVVSRRGRISVGPKECSVPVVTSTLCYQGNLRPGGTALYRICAYSGYPKLFDGLGV